MTAVCVKDEWRLIPAYASPAAEELPMFAESRVHQRSSGNPYPNKVVMQVDRKHRQEKSFRIITLENEYIRIELMPELGGRIYSAFDKRTGYDFFYKQHVIKPALIGMLGSWISGGCEFNWPCHHRPSTFMPVDIAIEKEPGGAVTVWMSENEPLNRMKGMVGVRLAPGEALFDTRMKVFNRTASRHSFLWWENAAVPVNEQYRLVFPPDVNYVQFHYRKNVTSYPIASGVYNGIRHGDGTDISYHKNTRQPTSYFCAQTDYDFFGGYDEGRKCGVIHVADHTISVGKKMFTWAYNQLSKSWEKALTDTDGAYAELMASSYSLNQPDFAWLMPYESKDFSQLWYPVGDIGMPLCACREAAVSIHDGKVFLQATVPLQDARLEINGQPVLFFSAGPESKAVFPVESEVTRLTLRDRMDRQLLCYTKPDPDTLKPMPDIIPDNPTLDTLKTAQEAFLMGVHAEQYRDPAIRPDAYWREALRKDPDDVPSLTRLAAYELDHLRPQQACELAQCAWKKVTIRNFHPESGELQYLTGRILEALDDPKNALDWYMQAAWAQDTRSRALTRAAMLQGRAGNWELMAALSEKALREHSGNETAQLLHAVAMRHIAPERSQTDLDILEKNDPLNMTAKALKTDTAKLFSAMGTDPCQTALDIAEDLWEAGESGLAAGILGGLPSKCAQTEYVRAYLMNDRLLLSDASALGTGIAYPLRPLEYRALRFAAEQRPSDTQALYLLGCLQYATGNYESAASVWEQAVQANPADYRLWRCLAVACYSHLSRREDALPMLDRALELRPHDGQLIWEKALVMTQLKIPASEIAAFLESETFDREDIVIELCRAYNRMGEWNKALELLNRTNFTPCEGGEHAVAEQYMFAHHALGRAFLAEGQTEKALEHFRYAQRLPDNLGAGLWNEVLLVPHQYYEAMCLKRLNREVEAEPLFRWILTFKQDYFTDMHLPDLPCWQAMAYRELGCPAPAQSLIAAHLRRQEASEKAVDAGYFKTTPFFISYMEDASVQRQAACLWQKAMAHFAAGDLATAEVLARKSMHGNPVNLYAGLLISQTPSEAAE